MLNREKCFHIFQECKVGNILMYEQKSMKKELEYKFNTNYATEMKTKMTIITNLKAAKGSVYILILLKKIAMARDLFILKFEQGEETYIPFELT